MQGCAALVLCYTHMPRQAACPAQRAANAGHSWRHAHTLNSGAKPMPNSKEVRLYQEINHWARLALKHCAKSPWCKVLALFLGLQLHSLWPPAPTPAAPSTPAPASPTTPTPSEAACCCFTFPPWRSRLLHLTIGTRPTVPSAAAATAAAATAAAAVRPTFSSAVSAAAVPVSVAAYRACPGIGLACVCQ
jgi:hypothetical protein